jgi:integrase
VRPGTAVLVVAERRTLRRDDDPVRVLRDHRVVWWTGGAPGLGVRRAKRFGSSAEAQRFAVALREDLAEVRDLSGTFARAVHDYFAAHDGSATRSTMQKYRGTLDKWVLPEIGDVALSDFGIVSVRRCFESANAEQVGPSVIKGIDTAIGAVVSFAAEGGAFGGRDPLPAAQRRTLKRRFVTLAEGRQRGPERTRRGAIGLRDALTPDQVEALALALRDEFDGRGYHVVKLLAGSGARWCELLGVQADWVDLDTHTLPLEYQAARREPWRTLVDLKNHEQRDVHVWPDAEASLAHLVEHAVDNCLLPRPEGYRWDWIARAERSLHAAMRAQGWPDRQRTHALRHHFATYSLAPPPVGHGIDLGRLSQLLGHESPEYTARIYVHSLGSEVRWRR